MKFNRVIPALLLIAAQLAASCGTEHVSDPDNSSDIADTTPADTTPIEEYVAPDVDYGGAEFTILDYDTDEYFWQAATYSDINAEEENGDPINDAQYKRNLKVEELLKVDIKTYPVGGVSRNQNHTELEKLIRAGDTTVDAAFLFASGIKSLLAEDGMLLDLNTIPTLDLSASWWDQNAVETFTIGDSLKVVNGDISLYSAFAPIHLFVNKTLAEDFKLDNMYDMVREGKWTWDKVFEYCTLVASDLNTDAKMDDTDRYGMAVQWHMLVDCLNSSGIKTVSKNSAGQHELSLNSERTIKIVEALVPFINNGNVNSIANNYYHKYSNPFYEMHIPMFKNNQLLFNFNQLLISFEMRSMETDYGILPMPKWDEEQDVYYTPMSTSWMTMLAVPSTNEKLEMTGHVLDALGYYSQQYVMPEFIDTTVRYKSLRDEDSAEMLELVLDSTLYDIGSIYNWGGVRGMVNDLVVNNDIGFSSAYAAKESAINTELAKTFEALTK